MSDGPRGFRTPLHHALDMASDRLSAFDRAQLIRPSMMPVRYETAHVPPKGSGQRVGRNSPCPCKSGKKFKHCCKVQPS
jgi:uncharacterized protein YecA (UPF0149 family)